MDAHELSERLAAFLQASHKARSVRIDGLRLLTGGASRQTWSFDATIEHPGGHSETLPLVLRRDPRESTGSMSRELEYRLLEAATEAGVPVPKVHLLGDETLGAPSFLMERVEGETIPRRILRDDAYADARVAMPAQLGAILAAIHRIPVTGALQALTAPPADSSPAASEVDRYEATYRAITPDPHPAFELAFRWLRERLPETTRQTLVHGDYRMGNLIVQPDGVRAILDWELAHVGDPMEDLGWLCVRSWRFGNDDLPVAGVGAREALVAAYESAGSEAVDAERVRFWEAFGNLRWGIICIAQAKAYLDGPQPERRAGNHRPPRRRDGVGAAGADGGGLMQDRPTFDELLAAVERFLDDEIVGKSEGAQRYNARVAANALRIVRRELERSDDALAREWAGLDELVGAAERPSERSAFVEALAARTSDLCKRIRAGDVDRDAALAHVRRTVRDKLVVTNPGWLGPV